MKVVEQARVQLVSDYGHKSVASQIKKKLEEKGYMNVTCQGDGGGEWLQGFKKLEEEGEEERVEKVMIELELNIEQWEDEE